MVSVDSNPYDTDVWNSKNKLMKAIYQFISFINSLVVRPIESRKRIRYSDKYISNSYDIFIVEID